jgi:hypothetical protein
MVLKNKLIIKKIFFLNQNKLNSIKSMDDLGKFLSTKLRKTRK